MPLRFPLYDQLRDTLLIFELLQDVSVFEPLDVEIIVCHDGELRQQIVGVLHGLGLLYILLQLDNVLNLLLKLVKLNKRVELNAKVELSIGIHLHVKRSFLDEFGILLELKVLHC